MIINIVRDGDCIAGKHRNCDGTGWDISADVPAACPCTCHRGGAE